MLKTIKTRIQFINPFELVWWCWTGI